MCHTRRPRPALVLALTRRNWFTLLVVALLVAAAPAPRCFGQTFISSLSGVVTDPAGAAVPNVRIEIRNTSTNDLREITSGKDGSYHFSNLSPGTYELSAQTPGFAKFNEANLTLVASTAAELNIRLTIGAVEQSVDVSGRAVLVDANSADSQATLNDTLVTALPTNSRSPLNFVFAFAGVQEAPAGMTSTSSNLDQMFSMFSMQGGRSGGVQILLDGAPATAIDWGGLMVSPTIESVQEMQLVKNTYDAQYGKSGEGIVSIISRGGSNRFHAVAYDFLRNDNLDATPWDTNRYGGTKGEFKRNQYGVNATGPIWNRKNLFFMGGYEALREPQTPTSGANTLPTAAERAGDFSKSFNADGTLATIYNPFSTRQIDDPANPGQKIWTRDIFTGNAIPAGMINGIAKNVVALYPQSNRTGEGPRGINNYFSAGKGMVRNDKIETRIDWAENSKNRIFGRWTQRTRQKNESPCFYCNGADTNKSDSNPGWQGTINDTLTPSPTLIVNVLVGMSRWSEQQISPSEGKLTAGDLGLKPSDYQASVMPQFNVDGYSQLGNPQVRKFVRYSHSLQATATKELGVHSIRFGFSGDLGMINNIQRNSAVFNFGRGMTSCDAVAGEACAAQTASTTTGNGLASLLLGVGGGTSDLQIDQAIAVRTYGAFLQDNWRVNRRLTLNVGLRYENQRPATERFNRIAYINPTIASPLNSQVNLGRTIMGGFEYASADNRFAWPENNKDFAPRIGAAYKVNDKLVVRAGVGRFYMPASSMISFDPAQFQGYGTSTTWVGSVNGYTVKDTLSNPFPNGKNQPTGNQEGLLTAVGQGVNQGWPWISHPNGNKWHFSFDFQYELGKNSVVEVGYTGWRANDLMLGQPSNANQLRVSDLSLGSKLDQDVANPFAGVITSGSLSGDTVPYHFLLRPFPQYEWINWTRSVSGAHADFNALNVRFQHQMKNGLSVLSTYQYSRTKDNSPEDFLGWGLGGEFRDIYNKEAEYTISAHDMPHSFVTALVYDLPVGKGKSFGANLPGPVNQIIGGWQTSTVIRLNSGLPLSPIMVGYNPLDKYGFGYYPPDMVGSPKVDKRTPERWFNTDAFAIPKDYTIGNAPRYNTDMREQGAKNVDLAVAKTFRAAEFMRVQFRAEFLNLFNTPQFGGQNLWGGGISTAMTWGTFGQVQGTRNGPRNIQLGLRLEY